MLKKFFGTKSDREIKKLYPLVDDINQIFSTLENKSDEDLIVRVAELRESVIQKRQSKKDELPESMDKEERAKAILAAEQVQLNAIMPEAFAIVKETCRRMVGHSWRMLGNEVIWDMVPYDVQLVGAIILHNGKVAEMKTGEGKTLVATMPIFLNALTGRGVHVVTVNDYLAQRDSEWMGEVYKRLGLSVGAILNTMNNEKRREMYQCDITYGTNNEFGFDYLRDNMAHSPENQVQRGHAFAVVDEVDSVLIDEARTPLIISGQIDAPVDTTFKELRPDVQKLVKRQSVLVTDLVREAQKLLGEDNEDDAGLKLLQAQRGMPKHPKVMKIFQESGMIKLAHDIESNFIRDKKMHEVDEDLYFSIDEKSHIIDLTDKGRIFLAPDNPETFIIPDLGGMLTDIEQNDTLSHMEVEQKKEEAHQLHASRSGTIHNFNQLLRAYTMYEKDVEYVVDHGKVLIVDEFTGRVLPGRRYSDGLHQALESKENVSIERETQTLATITIQNYFRLYDKLSGMTGTAETESEEFGSIYKLDVTVIPTHRPIARDDRDDLVYKTRREKYNAVIDELSECYQSGQPVLVGTITVEVSELLSRMLKRKKIPHNVLNAKQHQHEADIVSRAGQPGAITIATNMAGRGTDIKLGEGVKESGGLHIIGTERHESRRIDLQLRGRAGRQGDPGSSRFFISLEDDLMRLFGSDRIARVMDRLGAEDGEVIEHPWVTRSIGKAQQRVEARNFEFRRQVLEYDDVMNQQREVIYDRRRHALEEEDISSLISDMINDTVDDVLATHVPPDAHPEDWNFDGLMAELRNIFLQAPPITDDELPTLRQEGLRDRILEGVRETYDRRERLLGVESMRQVERMIYLSVFDEKWKEHLREMDDLKEGIGLRSYGQKNPLIEYKREGYEMFVALLEDINRETLRLMFRISVEERPTQPRAQRPERLSLVHEDATGMGFAGVPDPSSASPDELATNSTEGDGPKKQPVRVEKKVGRNEPCPCGSGKKYKQCHGRG